MRTRIALVAIIPIALITVTLLTQAATAQPARASIRSPHVTTDRSEQLTSFVRTGPATTTTTTTITLPDVHVATALLTGHAAGTKVVAPVVPPPPPAPIVVDTVTPYQRAAWDRVAMCEEGGNWQADGPRFSGGLGITRTNWSIYGGLQYASSAAQATPDQQIMVAERIQYSPPDQYGCASW
jgi:hypothetical protein